MANNYDSTIINSMLSNVVLTQLEYAFAPISSFTMDLSDSIGDIKACSVVVPFAASTASTSKNPTDLETANDTVSAVSLNLDLYHKSFSLTQKDLESGKRLENVYKLNLEQLGNDVVADLNSLMLSANFGLAYNSTASGFDAAALQTAWGTVDAGTKNCLLAPSLYTKFTPTSNTSYSVNGSLNGLAGFAGFYNHCFAVGSPTTNVKGFIGARDAIVGAFRIPGFNPDKYDIYQIVETSFGLPVLYTQHYSTKTGSTIGAFSVLGSFACGVKAKGKLIVAS